jgi:hypothetical protein
MKVLLSFVIILALAAASAYFGLPPLIEKATGKYVAEVQELKQKVEKLEAYAKAQEEADKRAQLPQDAQPGKIIKAVNALSSKLTDLEGSVKASATTMEQTIDAQKKSADESLKKQGVVIEALGKRFDANVKQLQFGAALGITRSHLLKVLLDVGAKNLGTAKTELGEVGETIERAKSLASDAQKRTLDNMQESLKKTMVELDNDLPSAINRLNLMWHDTNRLPVSG